VYRENEDSSWKRSVYLDTSYNPHTPYNHRSILNCEVVIEFDDDDKAVNKKLADEVCKRLSKDNIGFSKWFSGNKSVHVHFLIDVGEATNLTALKRVILKHYSEGIPNPDLQLCSDHLIRAEFGLHEKTGKYKTLIYKTKDFFLKSRLPQIIWDKYCDEMYTLSRRRLSTDLKDIEHSEVFKKIMDTAWYSTTVNDGRETMLYIIIQVLKKKYTKEDMIDYLWAWYKYTKGTKLSRNDIVMKVHYHYSKDYVVSESLLLRKLEEFGGKL